MTGRMVTGLAVAMMALAGCGKAETSAPVETQAAAPAAPDKGATGSDPAEAEVPANLATTPEAALAAMQGRWVGVEDPKATLTITGNRVDMGYDGDSSADQSFRLDFVTECEGHPISGPRLGFTLTADDMVLCYTDLEADADNLEYFYSPRGNRQAFRRPPSGT